MPPPALALSPLTDPPHLEPRRQAAPATSAPRSFVRLLLSCRGFALVQDTLKCCGHLGIGLRISCVEVGSVNTHWSFVLVQEPLEVCSHIGIGLSRCVRKCGTTLGHRLDQMAICNAKARVNQRPPHPVRSNGEIGVPEQRGNRGSGAARQWGLRSSGAMGSGRQ